MASQTDMKSIQGEKIKTAIPLCSSQDCEMFPLFTVSICMGYRKFALTSSGRVSSCRTWCTLQQCNSYMHPHIQYLLLIPPGFITMQFTKLLNKIVVYLTIYVVRLVGILFTAKRCGATRVLKHCWMELPCIIKILRCKLTYT